MPIYRLICDTCGEEQDIYRSVARMNEDLPQCCGELMHRKICAPAVIADIAPYQAMGIDVATGTAPMITSRSSHREYLKRNGYVEVGNEMPDTSKREVKGDFNVRQELKKAVQEVLPKYKN
ncbi:hypothetical protein [Paludibacterium sp.]|uniref:hypothetical protein n=1 Tax=Paludibacterium sp. TaxID=1917523 RepID=UPI0025E414A7|nr:hypothetical protein [Paludibacterium sp.]MBV8649691.1 hypothetical protein [Paludibacterium sp.]